MDDNVGISDHFITQGPYVDLTFEPQQITLKRGKSADVIVTLTYMTSNNVSSPPVSIKLQPPSNIIGLPSVANLTPQGRMEIINASAKSGIEPTGFFYTSHMMTNLGGPVNLNPGETKTIHLKLVIPVNYPDELLNKSVNIGVSGI